MVKRRNRSGKRNIKRYRSVANSEGTGLFNQKVQCQASLPRLTCNL